jgi:glycosyltransferase involved in cell wall biosynthesis
VLATRQPGQLATEVVDGARVTRLPIEHRWGGSALGVAREYLGFTALAALRAARLAGPRRYAVVHVHNPPDFLIVAALVPKLLGARVIFDVHDLAPDMFAMRLGRKRGARLADRVLRLLERAAAGLADDVLTVHEPYRQELGARGVPLEKITVVMNSVDERLLPPLRHDAPSDGFRVVYEGTLTPPYGVHLLVQAFAQIAHEVSDGRLEIYGDGDAAPEIHSLSETLGLQDRIWMSGRFLPQREVLERVQSASVGVIPNLPTSLNRFALSTKLFEYIALGLPVVSADLPTIRAHFSDDEVLFFKAGDARALASALLEVRRDPIAAASRSEAARLRYRRYGWAANAQRYADLLERSVQPAGVTEG